MGIYFLGVPPLPFMPRKGRGMRAVACYGSTGRAVGLFVAALQGTRHACLVPTALPLLSLTLYTPKFIPTIMSYTEKKQQIEALQQQIDAFGELSAEAKRKIDYKFRLDWNYYSNSMEGNTLTMAETRSVMIGNITIGGKPLKDVLEIKGHDEAIIPILKLGKGEVRLSETRIKEIHRQIIHEEDPEKKPLIGVWKTVPNYIYNYKGERFDFAAPEEVAERIHKLLDKTNAAIDAVFRNKKNAPHPIDVALAFHLEYVTIHPFYDGNGRTARIFTNLLLISFGYPPFWAKDGSERDAYGQYISEVQAYGSKPDVFYEFAADKIIRSQKLVLAAIEGKDIEDEEDFEKEIEMLRRIQNPPALERTPALEKAALKEVYFPLLKALDIQLAKLSGLFKSAHWAYFEEPNPNTPLSPTAADLRNICAYFEMVHKTKGYSSHGFKAVYWLNDYKSSAKSFEAECSTTMYFGETEYEVSVFVGLKFGGSAIFQGIKKLTDTLLGKEEDEELGKKNLLFSAPYGAPPTPEQIDQYAKQIAKDVLAYIKKLAL